MSAHCTTCGHECEECMRRRETKTRQRCACGCGRLLSGKRYHARYATDHCKSRVKRRRERQALEAY